MTKEQVSKAYEIANNGQEIGFDGIEIFDGYGLPDFKPVHATILQVAKLMKWQAQYISGQWDSEELNEICKLGRKRFIIID